MTPFNEKGDEGSNEPSLREKPSFKKDEKNQFKSKDMYYLYQL